MSINNIVSTGGYSYTAVNSLDSDDSVAVVAGDMLVVKISGRNAGAVLPEVSVSLVGGVDSGDPRSWSQYGSNVDILTRFFTIEITESRTAVVRVVSNLDLNQFDM